jgi:hypothetical protein
MTSPWQAGAGIAARAVQSLIAPSARAPTTAQTLASLLDLQGSVQLAHCLRRQEPARDARASELRAANESAPLLLGDYVRRRLEALDRPRRSGGLRGLPSAAGVHAELAASAPREPSAAAARGFAAGVARACRDHFLATLGRGRADVAALRDEVANDLKKLGGGAARLEALDAALREATSAGIERLGERFAAAHEGGLTARLAAAYLALPPAPTLADVAAWFEPRGVIGEPLASAGEVARALLRREAAILVALVDAACGGRGA